ncbi:hypothetical protein SCHPADRAFT_945665 [Schizopora paradoxa]|uniref:Uncharacterized protein n=1 Tax=Schizopora paradoxa TaxID=27342 RepID=A0A0H2RQ90_9AGAM|nr:hypothetical protein SCHPADRAFT_945665 [Schizopora paradoxa]
MPPQLKRCRRTNLTLDSCERRVLADKVNVLQAGLKSPVRSLAPSFSTRRSRHTSTCSQVSYAKTRSSRKVVDALPGGSTAQELPADILILIFRLGVKVDDEVPVSASQVCFHWRRVAISCPLLWCKLRPDGRVNLSRSRIARRRSLPLDIEIDDSPRIPSCTTPTLAKLHSQLSSTLPFLSSWHSLSINITSHYPYLWNTLLSKLCSKGSASSAPLLRRLSLVYPSNDDDKEFLLFGEQAPRLQDLRLHGIRLRWTPGLFENLVHLDYIHQVVTPSFEAIQEVLSMLATSSRLQTLTIGFQGTARSSPISWNVRKHIQSVTLPGLRKLTLRFLPGNSTRELLVLLKKLKLPNLAELRFANPSPSRLPRKLLAKVFRPFRYHPTLRSVALDEACYHPRHFCGFVQSLAVLSLISITRTSTQPLQPVEQLLGLGFRVRRQRGQLVFWREHMSDLFTPS